MGWLNFGGKKRKQGKGFGNSQQGKRRKPRKTFILEKIVTPSAGIGGWVQDFDALHQLLGSLPLPDLDLPNFLADSGVCPIDPSAPTNNLPPLIDFDPLGLYNNGIATQTPYNPGGAFETLPIALIPIDPHSPNPSNPNAIRQLLNFPLASQPLVGSIDTGVSADSPYLNYANIKKGRDYVGGDDNPLLKPGEGSEHGTFMLGIVDAINKTAPKWVGRAIDSGRWADSLVEFVDAARASGQKNAIANLSLDLTQKNADGSVTTRYELTTAERSAIEYARQNGVMLVVAAGNDGGVMSVLGQASQEFDNIFTVGAGDINGRSIYSSYGRGLDIVADGGTTEHPGLSTAGNDLGTMAGTSVATAKVAGAASLVWAANPALNYRQVMEILKSTARDLGPSGWDDETGFGFLNTLAAVDLAKKTTPEVYKPTAWVTPDTWSGEGKVTPSERAAQPVVPLPGQGKVPVNAGQFINTVVSNSVNIHYYTNGHLMVQPSGVESWYGSGTGLPVPNVKVTATPIPISITNQATAAEKGNVVAIPDANGKLRVFAVGADNNVWQWRESDNNMTAWHKMGLLAKEISVIRDKNGQLRVFGIGADNNVWQWRESDNNMTAWHKMGLLGKEIEVIQASDGSLRVFGIGTDDNVWQWRESDNNMTAWHKMGLLGKEIEVIQALDGSLRVFGIGTDDNVWQWRESDKNMTWWHKMGLLGEQLQVTRAKDGSLRVFGVGTDDNVWQWRESDNNMTAWQKMGLLGKELKVISDRDGNLRAFGIGTDDNVWQWRESDNNMTAWQKMGLLGKEIEVIQASDGSLRAFGIGTDDNVWQWRESDNNMTWWHKMGLLGRDLDVIQRPNGELRAFGVGTDDNLWQWRESDNNMTWWHKMGLLVQKPAKETANQGGSLNQLSNKSRLTIDEIIEYRQLVAKLPESERSQWYRKLQYKVPYFNQRDNGYSNIADEMCNVTTLASCLTYLGVKNPQPQRQFEDVLDDILQNNPAIYPNHGDNARYWWDELSKLATNLGVSSSGTTKIDGFSSTNLDFFKNFIRNNWEPALNQGKTIMAGVNTTQPGHIVKVIDVDWDRGGLVVDDPYGQAKDSPGSDYKRFNYSGTQNTKNRGSVNTQQGQDEQGIGNDNFWSWSYCAEIFGDTWYLILQEKGQPVSSGNNNGNGSEVTATYLNAKIKAFLDTIAYAEGTKNPDGYRTIYSYQYFNDFADHPRRVICAGGYCSNAAGRYQFLSSTWDGVKAKLGLKDFSPESQDLGAVELIKQRGAFSDLENGNIQAVIEKCSWEWASLPPGRYGQPQRSMAELLQVYQDSLTKYT